MTTSHYLITCSLKSATKFPIVYGPNLVQLLKDFAVEHYVIGILRNITFAAQLDQSQNTVT